MNIIRAKNYAGTCRDGDGGKIAQFCANSPKEIALATLICQRPLRHHAEGIAPTAERTWTRQRCSRELDPEPGIREQNRSTAAFECTYLIGRRVPASAKFVPFDPLR